MNPTLRLTTLLAALLLIAPACPSSDSPTSSDPPPTKPTPAPTTPTREAPAPPPSSAAPTAAIPADPDADTEPDSSAWFQSGCLACHGARGEGGVGPVLAGVLPTWEAFATRVRAGAPPMPAFPRSALSDDALRGLYAWLGTLPPPPKAPDARADVIRVPRGVDVERYAGDLKNPVALAWGPAPATHLRPGEPVLWVSTNGRRFPRPEQKSGAISWVPSPGAAPRVWAEGLDRPLGLLWVEGSEGPELLVSSRGKVAAWTDSNGRGAESRVVVDSLPSHGLHQNNGLTLGPDGRVYLGIGTRTNADPEREAPLNGTVIAFPLSGSPVETIATGLRNPFGLAFGPAGALFATDNAVDPPLAKDAAEELNRIETGGFYGHPWVHSDGKKLKDGLPAGATPISPFVLFPPHASANAVLHYTGPMFPTLRGKLLITEFGSYLRDYTDVGRRISSVDPSAGSPSRELWAANFLGRPVDLSQAPDGAILVSDYEAGTIWRFFASDRVREVFKPSFDCNKASTSLELAICGDRELARLDREMTSRYVALRRALPEERSLTLRAEQRKWLEDRDQCGRNTRMMQCLTERMETRLREFDALDGGR